FLMRRVKNHPWLLGLVCLMALNLWAGCNEKPAEQPLAEKQPAVEKDPVQPTDDPQPPAKETPQPQTEKVAPVQETPAPANPLREDPAPHAAENSSEKSPEQPADPPAAIENAYGHGGSELTAEQKKPPLADWPQDCKALLFLSG